MSDNEVLEFLRLYAKDYRVNAISSIVINSIVTNIDNKNLLDQKIIDATLTDFINYVGRKRNTKFMICVEEITL